MRPTITPFEFKNKIAAREKILLLDVRESYGHEKWSLGGEPIPLNQLRVRFKELDADNGIVVYCHHGNRSAYAVNFLTRRGFSNVKLLQGGIEIGQSKLVQPSPYLKDPSFQPAPVSAPAPECLQA